MRPSPFPLPVLALAACLASGAALAQADPPSPPQRQPAPPLRVAIYRGAEANVPPAVPVLRGSSAMGSPPPAEAPRPAPAGPRAAVGGSRLWIVDPASGGLVACRLGGTTQVGVDRVRCTEGGLP